ncbi:MAG: DUF3601 domain-containing protein [Chitinophagaceae bacterium]
MSLLKNISKLFSLGKETAPVKKQIPFGNAVSLIQGQQYCVVKSFIDYDKIVHPVGETGIYLGTTFLPYEDGLTIFFEQNNITTSYRMQWRKEEQADIIDNFASFVKAC